MKLRRQGIEKNNSLPPRASLHATKYAELVSRETAEAALLSVGFTISISMWPAWPPSWWRGGTKNNYRPIYSPARKRLGASNVSFQSGFERGVSSSQGTQPSVPRIVCSLSLRPVRPPGKPRQVT